MADERGWSERAVVIGAGAGGLGVAMELRRRGVEALVLERTPRPGCSWDGRYEGLRLNTVRQLSALPGSPIPRAAGRWVGRREFAAYLRRVARTTRIELGCEVTRIDRGGDDWLLSTSAGPRRARTTIVATGYDRISRLPEWPGVEGFRGEYLHSSSFGDATRYRGRDVLVVGPGNSGSEIATQLSLAGASRVRLSVRTGINLMPATILGIPATWFARMNESGSRRMVDGGSRLIQRLAFGDLRPYGLEPAPLGVATELRVKGMGPVLDRGFVAALKARRIEILAAVTGFAGTRVNLADGTAIEPEVVVAATGYRPGLEGLVGHLGVLDAHGRPLVRDGSGEIPGAGGLYFNGYWLPLSGQLPAVRRSSPRIARAIVRRIRPALTTQAEPTPAPA